MCVIILGQPLLRILHLKISDMLISFPTELFDQPFLFLMTLCVHSYWLNIQSLKKADKNSKSRLANRINYTAPINYHF